MALWPVARKNPDEPADGLTLRRTWIAGSYRLNGIGGPCRRSRTGTADLGTFAQAGFVGVADPPWLSRRRPSTRIPNRTGTLSVRPVLSDQHPPLVRARRRSRFKAKKRLHAPFAVPAGAFATACCTCRRLFAVLVRAFLLYLHAPLGMAAPPSHLPTKRPNEQTREEHGSPESSQP